MRDLSNGSRVLEEAVRWDRRNLKRIKQSTIDRASREVRQLWENEGNRIVLQRERLQQQREENEGPRGEEQQSTEAEEQVAGTSTQGRDVITTGEEQHGNKGTVDMTET